MRLYKVLVGVWQANVCKDIAAAHFNSFLMTLASNNYFARACFSASRNRRLTISMSPRGVSIPRFDFF
jgi:hypothetical protein